MHSNSRHLFPRLLFRAAGYECRSVQYHFHQSHVTEAGHFSFLFFSFLCFSVVYCVVLFCSPQFVFVLEQVVVFLVRLGYVYHKTMARSLGGVRQSATIQIQINKNVTSRTILGNN